MATNYSKRSSAQVKDETGNVYGKLTVIELDSIRVEARWRCRCDCGQLTTVAGSHLRKGDIKSCGCLRSSAGGGYKTTEYTTWKGIKHRCYNPRDSYYHLYGGRGITVCDRWRTSFVNFLADMGLKPFSEASIDRIDNDGNYEPENCRWATKLEQSQNSRKARMLTCNGETMCLRAWARRLGMSHGALCQRLKRGWSIKRSLTTPAMTSYIHLHHK